MYRELERHGIELVEEAAPVAEREVAQRVVTLEGTTDSLERFLHEIGRYPLLTKVEEIQLAKRVEQGDLEAKRRMIESNLRLVVSIAKKLPRPGPRLPGPDPGGHRRPDPRGREVRLAARSEVLDVRHLVDPPGRGAWTRRQVAHRAAAGARRRAAAEDQPRRAHALARLGRDPSDEEVAEEARLPLYQVLGVRSAARSAMSLDEPIGSDGESSFSDVLADDNAEDPAEVVGDAQRGMTLSSVLEALPERQRVVVTMRYGLDGRDPRTLDEIAKELRLTRERVRQIEVETLGQLAALRELQELRELPA